LGAEASMLPLVPKNSIFIYYYTLFIQILVGLFGLSIERAGGQFSSGIASVAET
jgi:hypothetical protein